MKMGNMGVSHLSWDGRNGASNKLVLDSKLVEIARKHQEQTTDKVTTSNNSLSRLAKKHFNNGNYWLFIYTYNAGQRAFNPNIVKLDQEFKIPSKEYINEMIDLIRKGEIKLNLKGIDIYSLKKIAITPCQQKIESVEPKTTSPSIVSEKPRFNAHQIAEEQRLKNFLSAKSPDIPVKKVQTKPIEAVAEATKRGNFFQRLWHDEIGGFKGFLELTFFGDFFRK